MTKYFFLVRKLELYNYKKNIFVSASFTVKLQCLSFLKQHCHVVLLFLSPSPYLAKFFPLLSTVKLLWSTCFKKCFKTWWHFAKCHCSVTQPLLVLKSDFSASFVLSSWWAHTKSGGPLENLPMPWQQEGCWLVIRLLRQPPLLTRCSSLNSSASLFCLSHMNLWVLSVKHKAWYHLLLFLISFLWTELRKCLHFPSLAW